MRTVEAGCDMKLNERSLDSRDIASRSENNFNALRFAAASAVVLSHGYELPSGLSQHDWAFAATGRALSWYAVNLFFFISGYLIFLSWERNPSPLSFFWARFLRLFPGLSVMLVLTVLILGIGFSALSFSQYILDTQTFRYLLGCLSIIFVRYELPGVFSSNPLNAVNGSLWTLRYEVFCYVCVAVIGMTGRFKSLQRRRIFLGGGLLITSTTLFYLDTRGIAQLNGKIAMAYELARLAMCFLLGGLYRELEGKLPLKLVAVLGLALLAMLAARTPLFVPIANVATAYAAVWFAFVPNGKWIRWTRVAPDYSYGIYIYAFPIQQALIASLPDASIVALLFPAFGITFVVAASSWHLVEKPALAHKHLLSTSPQNRPARAIS